MSDCNYGGGPLTAAYHPTFENIGGLQTWEAGYQSGGGKRRKKRSRKRSRRRNPDLSNKVVRGARFQTRPSASYHYKTLNKPVGYKISYRPRKGGKYILHELALRKNGSPYWKALEKLPKTRKQLRRSRGRSKGRSKGRSRGRRTRRGRAGSRHSPQAGGKWTVLRPPTRRRARRESGVWTVTRVKEARKVQSEGKKGKQMPVGTRVIISTWGRNPDSESGRDPRLHDPCPENLLTCKKYQRANCCGERDPHKGVVMGGEWKVFGSRIHKILFDDYEDLKEIDVFLNSTSVDIRWEVEGADKPTEGLPE